MIEFKDVSFQYEQGSSKGKIENINLTIHDGEVVLICGESGCGKTTFTRLINGLIPHYYEGTLTGQTLVEGIDVKNVSLYALSGVVGSVFQNPSRRCWFRLSESENTVFYGGHHQRNCVWMREFGNQRRGNQFADRKNGECVKN